jgi:hypothetical protein
MPVNSTHLEYDANAAVWLRARRVRPGSRRDGHFSLFFRPVIGVPFYYSSVLAHYSLTATCRFGIFSPLCVNRCRKRSKGAGRRSGSLCSRSHVGRPTRLPGNREVGRVTPCAPPFVSEVSDGAHEPRHRRSGSVTRPATTLRSGSPCTSLGGPRNFCPSFNRIFFQVIFGHVWSSSIPIPTGKSVQPILFSDQFRTVLDRFLPVLSSRSPSSRGPHMPTAHRLPHSRRAPKTGVKKGQKGTKSAKSCQTTTCKPAFTGLGCDC